MRREDFTIDIDVDGDQPTLSVTFTNTPRILRQRLDDDGTARDAAHLDVAYRRTQGEEAGVLGVTDRVTGEFIFEATVDTATIDRLVEAASATGGEDPCYSLRIEPGDDDPTVAEKGTLLVYDADGSLDRAGSLIPASVEI